MQQGGGLGSITDSHTGEGLLRLCILGRVQEGMDGSDQGAEERDQGSRLGGRQWTLAIPKCNCSNVADSVGI